MNKPIIILLCLLISIGELFSNDDLKSIQKFYKNAKVSLISGKTMQCKKVTLNDSLLTYSTKESSTTKTIPLSDVKEVRIPTRSKVLLGTFLGGVTGLGAALIINASGDKTTHSTSTITYTYDKSGQQSPNRSPEETTTEYVLSGGKIAGLVAGAAALGGLIGSQITGSWESIYIQSAASDSLDEDYYFNIKNYGRLKGKLLRIRPKYIYVVKDRILYKIYQKSLISILDLQKRNITENTLISKNFDGEGINFKNFSRVVELR